MVTLVNMTRKCFSQPQLQLTSRPLAYGQILKSPVSESIQACLTGEAEGTLWPHLDRPTCIEPEDRISPANPATTRARNILLPLFHRSTNLERSYTVFISCRCYGAQES